MKIKNIVILFATIVLLSFCNNKKKENTNIDYETFKKSVQIQKAELKNKSSEKVSEFLHKLLDDDIYSYWKGTTWDFNGTTQTPQNGNIACGYFVTNTLTDLGFKIKRIKLAQAASSKMINELCVEVAYFNEFEKLKTYFENQEDNSVFIIGLDFHTGYILKNAKEIYFFHSNYINKQGVVKEEIENSQALKNNKTFMLGNLTKNKKLLNKWIID